jgi:hypothetical protein
LQLLQLPAVQLHVVPPLGMVPTVHDPPELEPDPELELLPDPELEPELEPLPDPELAPDDPELEPLPDPALAPDDPELELLPDPALAPDAPELELLPDPELEPELPELDCPPELEPLDDNPPELEAPPASPSAPSFLSDEDEQEASTAVIAGRTKRTVALIANLHLRGVCGSDVRRPSSEALRSGNGSREAKPSSKGFFCKPSGRVFWRRPGRGCVPLSPTADPFGKGVKARTRRMCISGQM